VTLLAPQPLCTCFSNNLLLHRARRVLIAALNMSLRERLTVIITTSPIRSHPSMEMIAQVRASFSLIEVPLHPTIPTTHPAISLLRSPTRVRDCSTVLKSSSPMV
jgi:hypothetical protein